MFFDQWVYFICPFHYADIINKKTVFPALEIKMTEPGYPAHKEVEEYKKSSFFKDFSVGCGVLVLFGILIFVVLPLIAIAFRVALWLAVPVVAVALIVFLVALLGRLVLKAKKYW